jgi:hypothetical protein
MPAFDRQKLRAMPKPRLDALLARAQELPDHPDSAANIKAIEAVLAEQRQAYLEMPLADAVAAAFTEQPPTEAELGYLLMIHQHPGLDTEELAALSRHKGPGKHQIMIGSMCRERAHFLPDPVYVPERDGDFWSGTICELQEKTGAGGRVTHAWTLKPGTVDALRRLGFLR